MSTYLYTYPLSMNSSQSNGNGDHRVTFVALQPRFNTTAPSEGAMVALYLPPDALKTSYTQSFGDVEMGGLGLLARDSNISADMFDAGPAKALAQLSSVEAGIGAAIAKSTVNELSTGATAKLGTAVQALESKVGRIRNHHKAIIYQGPGGFRTFSFSFVMMPKSKKEAEEINKIVHFFKYHMHPGVPTGGRFNPTSGANSPRTASGGNINSSSSLTLSYPEEFKIRITPRGTSGDQDVGTSSNNGVPSSVKPLFKIDKCFLESLNVDYTTSGQPVFFDDGNEPVTTTLQLSFKETQLMTKEKIAEGF